MSCHAPVAVTGCASQTVSEARSLARTVVLNGFIPKLSNLATSRVPTYVGQLVDSAFEGATLKTVNPGLPTTYPCVTSNAKEMVDRQLYQLRESPGGGCPPVARSSNQPNE
jgi:hypothetical protein